MPLQILHIVSILSLGINICSCRSAEEQRNSEESVEPNSSLIGDWKGHQLFWSNDSLSGEGMVGWDLKIKLDSILEFSYPYTHNQGSKLSVKGDSIFYHNNSHNYNLAYKWTVDDTLLSLVGIFDFSRLTPERDSLTFIKTQFDRKVLQELKNIGFNSKILENHKWVFDEEQTQNYLWKDFDTTIYSPPIKMQFDPTFGYQIGYNKIVYNKDTFNLWHLHDQVLLVRRIIGNDTINLNYKSID